MKHIFLNPIRSKMIPTFSVRTFRTLPSNPQPALSIRWNDSEGNQIKKTLLFQDLEILEEYVKELVQKHTGAYIDLLRFSQESLEKKYAFVHRVINDCQKTLNS